MILQIVSIGVGKWVKTEIRGEDGCGTKISLKHLIKLKEQCYAFGR